MMCVCAIYTAISGRLSSFTCCDLYSYTSDQCYELPSPISYLYQGVMKVVGEAVRGTCFGSSIITIGNGCVCVCMCVYY